MGNHYHFVLHTRQANLSLLMRHINGVYTLAHNRRHHKVGHLFQKRFKAILVASCENREEALYRAHTGSALSMSAIARELGLSVSRLSRLIARAGRAKDKTPMHTRTRDGARENGTSESPADPGGLCRHLGPRLSGAAALRDDLEPHLGCAGMEHAQPARRAL